MRWILSTDSLVPRNCQWSEARTRNLFYKVQENQYWVCFVTQNGTTNPSDPSDVQTELPPMFEEYNSPLGSLQSDIGLDKSKQGCSDKGVCDWDGGDV
jgi:hypothetical protein